MKQRFLLGAAVVLAAVVALTGSPALAAEKTDVVIGTAGTSGTYYVVAAAMAKAINDHSKILNVTAQPTKGSLENINLTNAGEMEFGMSNSDGPYFAYNGTGMYAKLGKQNILGCMSLYMSCGQMVATKKSGIKTYADLRGKKVCLGPPGQTTVEMSRAIIRGYGMDPEKDIRPYYLAIDEGLQKLTDGEIDATFILAGTPTAGVINAASQAELVLVEPSDEALAVVLKDNPHFAEYIIPAGTYRGIDRDCKTIKVMTEIFVRPDIPDNIVYEFVKQALDNVADYRNSHVVCKEINAETSAKHVIPLHPGAEKYYREVGAIK